MEQVQFEFNVMMFGGKRSGKTSVLAAMEECFKEKFENTGLSIAPYDEATAKLMQEHRAKMDEYCSKKPGEVFKCKDQNTVDKKIHSFKIQIKDKPNGIIRLNFTDYPGEWVNDGSHLDELSEAVREAHVIIVAIDTPYLVELPSENGIGQYNDGRNFTDKLATLLKDNFHLNNKSPKKMVLFVPLKCEKYYHNKQMTLVNNLIEKAYSESLAYLVGDRNVEYCETVILPIITLGEVDFYDFKSNPDGSIVLNNKKHPTTEFYKKRNRNTKKASPLYCEQPAAFILMYLLDQAKESKVIKGDIFSMFFQGIWTFFQEVFMGMPTGEEYIKIRESVLNVINDEGYIHRFINDPLEYNLASGE